MGAQVPLAQLATLRFLPGPPMIRDENGMLAGYVYVDMVGRDMGGYVEDLNRVNVNDLKNFFMRWYGPNNATLTVGGDVKSTDVVKLVEKYFGNIPRCPEVERVKVPAAHLEKDRYVSYTDNYARLPLLAMVYPSVPNYDKDIAALACLAQVIGQGKNAVLYQQMVSHARVAQINNVRRAQVIRRPRSADLADDDVLANARPRQRLDVREAQRLPLLDALISHRCLPPQPRLLLLIHRMTDQPTRNQTHGCTDQRPLPRMTARAADGRARSRADCAAGQRPRARPIRRPVVRRDTTR